MSISKTIIALDFSSEQEVKNFLDNFDWSSDLKPHYVKVGMELFYAEGPRILEYLKSKNLKIFLDLKIHDIPNTAYGAISSLCKYGVDMMNVHASGGIAMMQRAKQAIIDSNSQAKLIAVTQLTSTDQNMLNNELNIQGDIESAVLRLAENTKTAGLDGIVCSPLEAQLIKNKIGKGFLTVCPGVRFADSTSHDQKRISTPEHALSNGADYIVMGRAFTESANPSSLLHLIH